MPPRISHSGSRGRGEGRGRGGPPTRGGPLIRPAPSPQSSLPSTSEHVTTIGVKRKAYGTSGKALTVLTNHFPVTIPKNIISHYDVITPSEKTLPVRLNMDLIAQLQTHVAPNIFTPRAVYDGRKNLFAATTLRFPNGENSFEFEVTLQDIRSPDAQATRDQKPYRIKLNKVAEINPVVLERFLEGKQSHDNDVLTAITALNVVVRQEPSLKYPFNVRSFFTDEEKLEIGSGIVLWRGYFQSIRPAIGKMLINIDISTGAMYKPGKLLELCLEYISIPGRPRAQSRALASLNPRERLHLQRFIQGVRIITIHTDRTGKASKTPRVVKKLSSEGAAKLRFKRREGGEMTVSGYFEGVLGRPLEYPNLPCVEVGSGALLPIELCEVLPGQIMRKQVPPQYIKDVLTFATRSPTDRLKSIKSGLNVLSYGQSDYVRQFGMHLQSESPMQTRARVLPAPTLKYGDKGRKKSVTPQNGAWNMVDMEFYNPKNIPGWIVVIFEGRERFNERAAGDMVKGLVNSFRQVGMKCNDERPLVEYCGSQGNIIESLKAVGSKHKHQKGSPPGLVIVVLPEGATDMYIKIKHFGDCATGVATQCLRSNKCYRAKEQYYANVCLKINVKLGGINSIPDPASVRYLTDDANPTIVMGADVVHPAPGSKGHPSYTAVVGNVDSTAAYYVASSPRVQTSRQEMIEDLEEMAAHVLRLYISYRKNKERKTNINPKRIVFYRDGVSEGQFQQVLEFEVPKLRAACQRLEINPLPQITVVVVGKRHHVRFFPLSPHDGDRKTGNCPPGTVVDTDVTHPTEFDFYLQSHGGLLGTSRPAHYNVLLDENNFTPDGIQQLSYALCHVYARSTRSVSIPAPVYYADIVCARAKNHFDPKFKEESDTHTSDETAVKSLEEYKEHFKNLHESAQYKMYFS
ncbi:hypothetical protein ACEPAI_6207 [Sanghuangporus weigelae]